VKVVKKMYNAQTERINNSYNH